MKRFNLSDWAAIAEVVGTVGVIVSLVFVVHSINLNTKAMQASNDNFIYGLNDANLEFVADSEGFASIFVKVRNNEELSSVEALRFEVNLFRFVNLWELAFKRHQEGLMAEDSWQVWDRSFSTTFLQLYPRDLWEEASAASTSDFTAHVDEVLSRN